MKQFFLGFLLALLLAILFCRFWGCPPGPREACVTPNPLIQLDAPQDSFAVTPRGVPGATAVALSVFDADGDSLVAFAATPGQKLTMRFDTSAARPLQLCFRYQDGGGGTVARDSILIDDIILQGGVPDMDIVMGVVSPAQSCPGASQNVQVTTNNGVSTFAWANTGEIFTVTLTCGGNTHKFIVKTVSGGSSTGNCPHVHAEVHDAACFNCLSNTGRTPNSNSEMQLANISQFCTVKVYDSCNGSSNRTIEITHPTTCSIAVQK